MHCFNDDLSVDRPQGYGSAIEAAWAIGQLQAHLQSLTSAPGALDLFQVALFWEQAKHALRCEGYAFTDDRFAAWAAGVVTLDPDARPGLRSARGIVMAIVSQTRWMSPTAMKWSADLARPPVDVDQRSAIAEVIEAIERAQFFVATCAQGDRGVWGVRGALEAAEGIAQAMRASSSFAGLEDPGGKIAIDNGEVRIDPREASPLAWVVDLHMGAILLGRPLPCPGFGRLVTLRRYDDESLADQVMRAIVESASAMSALIAHVMDVCASARSIRANVTKASHLPDLVQLLAVCGALRNSQIMGAFGVTTLGARGLVAKGRDLGCVWSQTMSGVCLYKARLPFPGVSRLVCDNALPEYDSRAAADLDVAMAELDRLNARLGLVAEDLSDGF